MQHTGVLVTLLSVLVPATINGLPIDESPTLDLHVATVGFEDDHRQASHASRLAEGLAINRRVSTLQAPRDDEDSTRQKIRRTFLLRASGAAKYDIAHHRRALSHDYPYKNHPADPPGESCLWQGLYYYDNNMQTAPPDEPPSWWKDSSVALLRDRYASRMSMRKWGPNHGWIPIYCVKTPPAAVSTAIRPPKSGNHR